MNGFDNRFLDELKNKNDIVDIVGKYMRLEQRGGNFWGRCPFHHEKTASFCVHPIGQFFYCFGCHQSGDVIRFVMEIEALDFADAVKFLAEKANMPLPERKYDDQKVREQKHQKQRCLEVLKETALYYVGNLRSEKASAHLDYASKRGLDAATLVKFGMGASLDFNSLPNYLRSKGYTDEEMVLSGACGEKNGRVFDWLGGRFTIPLVDQFGNVISFAGRRIDGVKEQKYINTKETLVFSKGRTFFNLNNLKKEKNENGIDSVIIVEGHLDVVSLVQAGFPNVVASMGTAFTKDQARILKRFSEKVYISFDGDFAGQKAAVRGLEILKEEGLDVKVITLPDGMDPDDVVKKIGAEAYAKLIKDAKPLIDFKLDVLKKTFDINTVDGKRKFITAAVKVIRESPSPAEQEDLLKTVRDLTKVTYESLKRELHNAEEKVESSVTAELPKFNDNAGDKIDIAARFVLASYVFGKPYAFETDIKSVNFYSPAHNAVKEYLVKKISDGEKAKFSELFDYLPEDYYEELSRIAGLEAEDRRFDEAKYFADCLKTLRAEDINREIEMLTELFKNETDADERRRIASELNARLTEKNKLSKS